MNYGYVMVEIGFIVSLIIMIMIIFVNKQKQVAHLIINTVTMSTYSGALFRIEYIY